MNGMMSPQEVYDEPHRWLNVPHEHHEVLGELMPKMFDNWEGRLTNVHCLQCEGEEPFVVIDKQDFIEKLVTGYITGEDGEVSWFNLKEIEESFLSLVVLFKIIVSFL